MDHTCCYVVNVVFVFRVSHAASVWQPFGSIYGLRNWLHYRVESLPETVAALRVMLEQICTFVQAFKPTNSFYDFSVFMVSQSTLL